MTDNVRHIFKNGQIVKANALELADILEEEAIDPDVRAQQSVDERRDALFDDIRGERNRLLADSDWTQSADSPLTTEQKTSWATYRQSLRDFPSTFLDDDDNVLLTILEPTWPTKPS